MNSTSARPAPEVFYESSGASKFFTSPTVKRRRPPDFDQTLKPLNIDIEVTSKSIQHCPKHRLHRHELSPSLMRRSFWNTKCSCLSSALPDEIMLFNVFRFLNRDEICVSASVCTRWKWLSSDRLLWSKLDVGPHAHQIDDFQLGTILQRHGGYMDTVKLCNATLLSSVFLSNFSTMVPQLKEVHLCKTKHVNDNMVTSLVKACPKLTSMSLFGCSLITDAGVRAIGFYLPHLKELSVRGCKQLTDQSLVTLSPMLESLNVGGCTRMTAEAVLMMASRCRKLRRLNLHGINISDAALAFLVRGCPQLQNLQASSANPFGGGSDITDVGVAALATLPGLESLNLQGSSGISDQGLIALANGCKGLECLNLGGVYRITDQGVAEMTKHMTELTQISLFQCFNLSDLSASRIAELPKLEQLDLHSCVGLTKVLDILGAAAPMLRVLDVGSCRNIPEEDVQLFQQYRPDVKLTHY